MGGNYSREETIRGNTVNFMPSIRGFWNKFVKLISEIMDNL
jgi:hypothetical protein